MKRGILAAVLVVAFIVTIIVTSYVSRLPESNCATSPASELWSGDHLYKATLLRKDCNRGEAFFYSVRIDKANTPTGGWFFTKEIEVDGTDLPMPPPPTMRWTGHRLEIEIQAVSLSGSFEHRQGDLTLVRAYVRPKTPQK
jgi:hypothetical protein